jgi:hypothetical protein
MKFVRSAMVALYPTTAEDGPGIADTGIDDFLKRYRKDAPTALYVGLVAGCALFHVTPLLTVKKPVPAFMLSPEDLDRHADAIASHPAYLIRQAMMVVKLAAGLCWGADDAVRDRMNLRPYDPDPGTWKQS